MVCLFSLLHLRVFTRSARITTEAAEADADHLLYTGKERSTGIRTRSTDRSINQSIDRSININQPPNQSINR
jgi:hypothetical protein